jgi:hypothetical protein
MGRGVERLAHRIRGEDNAANNDGEFDIAPEFTSTALPDPTPRAAIGGPIAVNFS